MADGEVDPNNHNNNQDDSKKSQLTIILPGNGHLNQPLFAANQQANINAIANPDGVFDDPQTEQLNQEINNLIASG